MTQTDIEVNHLEEIVGDLETPCDYANDGYGTCPDDRAAWILHLVRCATCGEGGVRLACTPCKDRRVFGEEAVECNCGDVTFPAREAYSQIEAL